MAQLCFAVKFLHDKGVIHRNIKPAKIQLTADLDVKLADLDIAT